MTIGEVAVGEWGEMKHSLLFVFLYLFMLCAHKSYMGLWHHHESP